MIIIFYSANKTKELSPGYSLSDSFEGLLPRNKVGVRIYRKFCKQTNKKKVVRTSDDSYQVIKPDISS